MLRRSFYKSWRFAITMCNVGNTTPSYKRKVTLQIEVSGYFYLHWSEVIFHSVINQSNV